jgi:hypothetical protein
MPVNMTTSPDSNVDPPAAMSPTPKRTMIELRVAKTFQAFRSKKPPRFSGALIAAADYSCPPGSARAARLHAEGDMMRPWPSSGA